MQPYGAVRYSRIQYGGAASLFRTLAEWVFSAVEMRRNQWAQTLTDTVKALVWLTIRRSNNSSFGD